MQLPASQTTIVSFMTKHSGVKSCTITLLAGHFLFTSSLCCRMYHLATKQWSAKKLTGIKSRLQLETVNKTVCTVAIPYIIHSTISDSWTSCLSSKKETDTTICSNPNQMLQKVTAQILLTSDWQLHRRCNCESKVVKNSTWEVEVLHYFHNYTPQTSDHYKGSFQDHPHLHKNLEYCCYACHCVSDY